jgi:hypothetical protein
MDGLGATGGSRGLHTSARVAYARERERESRKPDSLPMSAWDHVFSDLESTPFVAPSRRPAPSPSMSKDGGIKPFRRQTMSAREISAFDEMFNMLFNAVAPKTPSAQTQAHTPSVGYTHHTERLRKAAMRLPRPLTPEEIQTLDAKKEEMELCETDFELLQWAEREIFADSIEQLKKYEKNFLKLFSQELSTSEAASSSPIPNPKFEMEVEIQNPLYSPLLVNLMLLAMHKFNNTQLARTLFLHAANLSFPSYIHACTTASFNVYLEALWTSTRDLKSVMESVEEMHRSGVKRDGSTRSIVAKIRRDLEEVLRDSPMVFDDAVREMSELKLEEEQEHSPRVNVRRRIGILDESDIFLLLEEMDTLCAEDPSDVFASEESASTYSIPAWKEEWKASPSSSRDHEQDRLTFVDDPLPSDSPDAWLSESAINDDWTSPSHYQNLLPPEWRNQSQSLHSGARQSSHGRNRRGSTSSRDYRKEKFLSHSDSPSYSQERSIRNPW